MSPASSGDWYVCFQWPDRFISVWLADAPTSFEDALTNAARVFRTISPAILLWWYEHAAPSPRPVVEAYPIGEFSARAVSGRLSRSTPGDAVHIASRTFADLTDAQRREWCSLLSRQGIDIAIDDRVPRGTIAVSVLSDDAGGTTTVA